EHLFFTCPFSLEFWNTLFAQTPMSPPHDFELCLIWLRSSSTDAKLKIMCKIIFQAAVYLLWKERNTRIHTSTSRPVISMVKELQLILRAKLHGLDQKVTFLQPATRSTA